VRSSALRLARRGGLGSKVSEKGGRFLAVLEGGNPFRRGRRKGDSALKRSRLIQGRGRGRQGRKNQRRNVVDPALLKRRRPYKQSFFLERSLGGRPVERRAGTVIVKSFQNRMIERLSSSRGNYIREGIKGRGELIREKGRLVFISGGGKGRKQKALLFRKKGVRH